MILFGVGACAAPPTPAETPTPTIPPPTPAIETANLKIHYPEFVDEEVKKEQARILQQAYDFYFQLIGQEYPFSGSKIEIIFDSSLVNVSYSGNPIRMGTDSGIFDGKILPPEPAFFHELVHDFTIQDRTSVAKYVDINGAITEAFADLFTYYFAHEELKYSKDDIYRYAGWAAYCRNTLKEYETKKIDPYSLNWGTHKDAQPYICSILFYLSEKYGWDVWNRFFRVARDSNVEGIPLHKQGSFTDLRRSEDAIVFGNFVYILSVAAGEDLIAAFENWGFQFEKETKERADNIQKDYSEYLSGLAKQYYQEALNKLDAQGYTEAVQKLELTMRIYQSFGDVQKVEEIETLIEKIKSKNIIIDGSIEDWPSNIAMVSDPAGDVSSDAKDKRGVDLKAVRAFMDENYLYVAIQIYDVFETSLLRNYFVALDFDGDKQDEYHFGFRPNGDTWVFDHSRDKNNWNAEDTWDVLALGKQDTIEMVISRKEYRIPSDILIYCRVTDGVSTLDTTEWFKVPLITTISGVAFHDFNGNGTWEADEPLIQGVKLEFVNNTNTEKACEDIGVDGRYSLRLPAGSYTLRILTKDIVGYNNQPYRYMSVSKNEFKSLSSPINININSDLEFNIPLMQGYLTLPFPKGTIETGQRVYVSINPEGDIGRDWRGVLYVRADHLGTDFFLPTNTPILAAAPGVVVESRWSDDDGNLISIRHPDGNLTIYCHLETRDAYPGNSVSRGDKIGTSGNTGRLVGPNPHLHFQFGNYGRDRIDPYRDITSPSSVSWWIVDNDPKYP